jgi:hypothetical protein
MEKLKKTITYLLNCTNKDQKNLKQGYLHFYAKFKYQGQHQPKGYFYQNIKKGLGKIPKYYGNKFIQSVIKILQKILNEKLKRCSKTFLDETQSGFRKG